MFFIFPADTVQTQEKDLYTPPGSAAAPHSFTHTGLAWQHSARMLVRVRSSTDAVIALSASPTPGVEATYAITLAGSGSNNAISLGVGQPPVVTAPGGYLHGSAFEWFWLSWLRDSYGRRIKVGRGICYDEDTFLDFYHEAPVYGVYYISAGTTSMTGAIWHFSY